MKLNDTENQIVELLKNSRLRSLEIKEKLDIGFHKLYPALHRLRRGGFLVEEKEKNMLYYKLVKKEENINI